jgi:hypothetical protein
MLALAQELVDSIIDWSAVEDQDTMKPCGLVCKRWLPRSRYNLFRTICLTASNLRSFVDIINTSHHPILSFVQHLELQYLDRPLKPGLLVMVHHCPNLTGIVIQILGDSDDELEEPHFSAVKWLDSDENLHAHLCAWSANSKVSISSLGIGLGGMIDCPLGALNSIMSCVPSVVKLDVYDALSISNDTASVTSLPPQLIELYLEIEEGGDVLFWLLSDPVMASLKSLGFMGYFGHHNAEESTLGLLSKTYGGEWRLWTCI